MDTNKKRRNNEKTQENRKKYPPLSSLSGRGSLFEREEILNSSVCSEPGDGESGGMMVESNASSHKKIEDLIKSDAGPELSNGHGDKSEQNGLNDVQLDSQHSSFLKPMISTFGKEAADGESGAVAVVKNASSSDSTNDDNNSNKNGEPEKSDTGPELSSNNDCKSQQKGLDNGQLVSQRYPFRKPLVRSFKYTADVFMQDQPCYVAAPKCAKCRECCLNERAKNICRFYKFRLLTYTNTGVVRVAGFSDANKPVCEEDVKLWLPQPDNPPSDLNFDTAVFLLTQVGDEFCDLSKEESSFALHLSKDKTVAWKRPVKGIREMCDVCKTTLFNFHWTCRKCGFAVCFDCYKGRQDGTVKIWSTRVKDEGKDEVYWLLCTNKKPHIQEKLMLTQFIPNDLLFKLGQQCHEIRSRLGIPQDCKCALSKELSQNQPSCNYKNECTSNSEKQDFKFHSLTTNRDDDDDVNLALQDMIENREATVSSDSDDDQDGNCSSLRELLCNPSSLNNNESSSESPLNENSVRPSAMNTLDNLDVIHSVIEQQSLANGNEVEEPERPPESEMPNYMNNNNTPQKVRKQIPIRIMTLAESSDLYPGVPHAWLCSGEVLRLKDSNHEGNYCIFQDQWKCGQPVIVSGLVKHLDLNLWQPDTFAKNFAAVKNDLINCMTGKVVPNQPMNKFWNGFENYSLRLRDEQGVPMLLKLKDWPPADDFAEMLPCHFKNLMEVLPLSEYTHREGHLNLASHLPQCFVRPDLGPKMYNAYGSAQFPSKGTTNLHLDISDAVNVMVYVGIPKDVDREEIIRDVMHTIKVAGCDFITRRRVEEENEIPGALWHIYHVKDTAKIRDFLNMVAMEKGRRLQPQHDPIHDQYWYLNASLRERLLRDYGVRGYAILQCLGDAVFIPAGAPHQVLNLHSCIKVAEDFVSPENIGHCLHLTQEFRELSDTHFNHEDKLQIKSIIYHTVKDSLSVIKKVIGS